MQKGRKSGILYRKRFQSALGGQKYEQSMHYVRQGQSGRQQRKPLAQKDKAHFQRQRTQGHGGD